MNSRETRKISLSTRMCVLKVRPNTPKWIKNSDKKLYTFVTSMSPYDTGEYSLNGICRQLPVAMTHCVSSITHTNTFNSIHTTNSTQKSETMPDLLIINISLTDQLNNKLIKPLELLHQVILSVNDCRKQQGYNSLYLMHYNEAKRSLEPSPDLMLYRYLPKLMHVIANPVPKIGKNSNSPILIENVFEGKNKTHKRFRVYSL